MKKVIYNNKSIGYLTKYYFASREEFLNWVVNNVTNPAVIKKVFE